MAEEKDKTQIAPGEQEAAPKKGGSKKLLLIGGIGAGILVVGVALALFVLKPMFSSNTTSGTEHKQTASTESHKSTEPKKERKHEAGDPIVLAIKDIVVNPAGTAGSRFLSVSFGFEMQSQTAANAFEQHEEAVRDALITILSSKSLADLTDVKQKEIMRVQIKKRLAQVLQTDDLTSVYYTAFVLQ